MGFWENRRKAAEEERRQRKELERKRAESKEKLKQSSKALWSAIGQGITKAIEEKKVEFQTEHLAAQEREATLKRLITDPTALDDYSDVELEHLRLTTESEIADHETELKNMDKEIAKDNGSLNAIDQFMVAQIKDVRASWEKSLRDQRLLLQLINSNQQRRKQPQQKPPVARHEQRTKLLSELNQLRTEKNETIKNLLASGASEEEIRRYENMYGNAIRQKEQQLERLLI